LYQYDEELYRPAILEQLKSDDVYVLKRTAEYLRDYDENPAPYVQPLIDAVMRNGIIESVVATLAVFTDNKFDALCAKYAVAAAIVNPESIKTTIPVLFRLFEFSKAMQIILDIDDLSLEDFVKCLGKSSVKANLEAANWLMGLKPRNTVLKGIIATLFRSFQSNDIEIAIPAARDLVVIAKNTKSMKLKQYIMARLEARWNRNRDNDDKYSNLLRWAVNEIGGVYAGETPLEEWIDFDPDPLIEEKIYPEGGPEEGLIELLSKLEKEG
jgi:hypothetical protein